LYKLSPQELIDCEEGSQGCVKGLLDSAFRYIIKNKGLDSDVEYLYLAMKGTCHRDATRFRFGKITSYNMVGLNEEYLQEAVANQSISQLTWLKVISSKLIRERYLWDHVTSKSRSKETIGI
jgi:hypothetical protein